MLFFSFEKQARPLRAPHSMVQACCKTHAALLRGLSRWHGGFDSGWHGRRADQLQAADDQLCSKPAPARTRVAQGEPCAGQRLLRKAVSVLASGVLVGWLGLAGGRLWAADTAAPAAQPASRAAVPLVGPPPIQPASLSASPSTSPSASPSASHRVIPLARSRGHAVPSVCPGPVLRFERLAPGLWLVPGFSGEADAQNRGQVSNLVLARQAGRLWALGSGPTPVFGRALACQAQQRLGLPLTEVISPWARPELVLGVTGVAQAAAAQGLVLRHWALAEVAGAMAEQCPRCVERLSQRLQGAADDLGAAPISPPDERLQGTHGRLGPFRWWRLPRSETGWVTVWRAQAVPLWVAPGVLDNSGPPDGRDADLALLQHTSLQLAGLAAADGAAARFVGEQGPVMDSAAPVRHAAYWAALLAAVAAAIERGDDESAPASALAGFPAAWARHPWHSFNWQRAWRQVELQVLAAPVR